MNSWVRRCAVLVLRVAGVGLGAYHFAWVAVAVFALMVRAFGETFAPARATLALVTTSNFLIFGLTLWRLADVVGAPARGPRMVLSLLWITVAQQLAAAALAHESYWNEFGEGLFVARPTAGELLGAGPILLGAAWLMSLAMHTGDVSVAAPRAPASSRAPSWAAYGLVMLGLGCAVRTLIEIGPAEHVEHVSNLAAMAECFAAAAAVEAWWGGSRHPGAPAPNLREWVALLLGLEVVRVVARQEIVNNLFAYGFIEAMSEYLVFTKGRIWNAVAIAVQLTLALAGAAIVLRASIHAVGAPGPPREPLPRLLGRRRPVHAIVLLTSGIVAGLAVAAAGAIVRDGQPVTAAIELLGFAALLGGSGLECADALRAGQAARFPAGRGALLLAIGLVVSLGAALARIASWLAG